MNPPRNIVCATDFGPASAHAVALALDLAKTFEGSVTLVHVFDAPVHAGPPFMPLVDEGASVEAGARRELEAAVNLAKKELDRTRGVLRRGRPWEEVLAFSAESRADVVVVGTHGRKGLPRAILGSVAEKIVRLSPIPVLTVPMAEAPPEH